MKIDIKKEIPLIGIVLLPFLYLAYIWQDLPNKVPVHWNIKGEIDRYGDKSELLLIPFLLPLLIYIIFLIVPFIDPKKNIEKMGKKYGTIKFLLTLFMSVLATYILYSAKTASISSPNGIILLLGILFIILGNFFKTMKPNYFIGIRTPWTLENEDIWKNTHLLAGKLWFIGGILIVSASLLLTEELNTYFFISTTILICLIPILSSYIQYQKIEKDNSAK